MDLSLSVRATLIALNILLSQQPGVSADDDHGDHSWGYSGERGPDHWAKLAPTCAGSHQSPIDIDPSAALRENFQPLFFGNYDVIPKKSEVENNGHTVVYSMETDRVPYISDGGLLNKYFFHQLHFHWGKDSSRGSEHRIKSTKYAGEIHIVHFNEKYGNFKNSTKHPDGLAVVGLFLTATSSDHAALRSIVEVLPKVQKADSDTSVVTPVALKDLLPSSTAKFYRYRGSLTTPGCNEIVTWTVLDAPLAVSEKQLSKFRELRGEKGPLAENYRPPQPLQGRVVHVRSGASKLAATGSLGFVLTLCLFSKL